MADANDILARLHEYRADIQGELDASAFTAFEERRMALGARSADAETAEAEEELLAHVLTLVYEHPAVESLLREQVPGLLPEDAAPTAATPSDTSPLPTRADPTEAPTTAHDLVHLDAGSAKPVVETPDALSQAPTANKSWTPDLRIQAFKEGVSAVIGLLLIGVTVYLAARTFNLAGDEARVADSREILQLMLGLAGVVVGYYFGRVPAEAQATQARQEANAASATAEAVSAKGEELASHVERALSGAAVTRAGSPAPEDVERIRGMLDELRAISRRR